MSNNYKKISRSTFYKHFKRKVVFSQELKNSLFTTFYEAEKRQTYVTVGALLYGLIYQKNSLSCRLFLKVLQLSKNNNSLSLQQINNRLKILGYQSEFKNTHFVKTNKDYKMPYLTPEVREILKIAVRSSLKSNKKVCIVTTKDIFFELISRESVRDSLTQAVN